MPYLAARQKGGGGRGGSGRADAESRPSNVKFEDAMEMEDAVLVLDDAAKRERQKTNLGEKFADSWQQFEGFEGPAKRGPGCVEGPATRKPGCYCLKCGGFKEMMQE